MLQLKIDKGITDSVWPELRERKRRGRGRGGGKGGGRGGRRERSENREDRSNEGAKNRK